MEKQRFDEYVVVIFGGTSGIGLMTAIEFANHGAKHVIVSGRSPWKWERAIGLIQNNYQTQLTDKIIHIGQSTIEYIQCDVRLEESVKELISGVIDKYGYVNVYFNNAGVQDTSGRSDGDDISKLQLESHQMEDGSLIYRLPKSNNAHCSTPATDFCENPIMTSVFGVFYCLKWEMHFASIQEPNVPISIINTSSRNGINIPSHKQPIYAASKAFVHSLTQTIATQAAIKGKKIGRKIRINCIAPGPILTPLEIPLYVKTKENVFEQPNEDEMAEFEKNGSKGVPLGRTGRTDEVSPTVLFLADEQQSSYITGTTISMDGGYTASPII